MNTQNDGWIKMSERRPTEKDLPIWASNGRREVWFVRDGKIDWHFGGVGQGWDKDCYWKPATVPAPPAKEKTQRETDEEAFKKHAEHACPGWTKSGLEIWHAALAYRDKQNAKDLAGYATTHESILRAKRRCGLDQ